MPAANGFDVAPTRTPISTYIPINFDALYRIGKEQNEAVERANKELTQQLLTFGEFLSLSDVDTSNYYNLSIGLLMPLVDEAVLNPDAMKDAAFRARLQQRINSLPYDLLSKLKQSRDTLAERKTNEETLMKTDHYSPLWHGGFDYSNYDTINNGVFTDTTLVPYMSLPELVAPYLDNLKNSYLYSSGGYDYSGVSSNMTDALINANLSDIMSTPLALEYIKLYMMLNPNITLEDALNILLLQLLTAGRKYTHIERTANPYALAGYKTDSRSRSGSTALYQTNGLMNLSDCLRQDATKTCNMFISDDMFSTDNTGGTVIDNTKFARNVASYLSAAFLADAVGNNSGKTLKRGVDDVINLLSSSISSDALRTLIGRGINVGSGKNGYYSGETSDLNKYILPGLFVINIGTAADDIYYYGNRNSVTAPRYEDAKLFWDWSRSDYLQSSIPAPFSEDNKLFIRLNKNQEKDLATVNELLNLILNKNFDYHVSSGSSIVTNPLNGDIYLKRDLCIPYDSFKDNFAQINDEQFISMIRLAGGVVTKLDLSEGTIINFNPATGTTNTSLRESSSGLYVVLPALYPIDLSGSEAVTGGDAAYNKGLSLGTSTNTTLLGLSQYSTYLGNNSN